MAQSEPLEQLASTGLLKREPPGREEIAGLLHTAAVRLEDARKAARCRRNSTLSYANVYSALPA